MRNSDPRGSRPDPLIGLPAGTIAEPRRRCDLIIYPGEEERPVGELPHPPDPHGRRRPPEDPDHPGAGLLDTGADRKKRRLTAPVRPDHGDVACIYREVRDLDEPVPKIGDLDHATRFPIANAAAAFTASPMINGATPIRTAWRSEIDADQASHTTPKR